MDKKKHNDNFRHMVQAMWAIVTNSYIIGFVRGKIYQGKMKSVCVPGLNCYSCPGAVAACPIGALQAVIGSFEYKFAFYIAGFMICVGALMGRLVCGFLCPFGLIQDLLNKIPLPEKLKVDGFRGDRLLRKLKYVIFAAFVVLMPLFFTDIIGQGYPWFCKLICPAGTLEGGIPLVLLNTALHESLGFLYVWKNVILAVIVLLSIAIYRPFCKYLCPLGAIYSVFNPISVLKYHVSEEKCTHCGVCAKTCKMGCEPVKNANSLECIRCGKCHVMCPQGAIDYEVAGKKIRQLKHNATGEKPVDEGKGERKTSSPLPDCRCAKIQIGANCEKN